MTRYVALLRGINVGGITIKMADLAELVRGLGYDEVTTVLASGNVVFATKDSAATAKRKLEAALSERFGYEAYVHVLTEAQLRTIVEGYPFGRGREGWHDYVVFVPDAAARAAILAVDLDADLEKAEAGEGVVYWTIQKGRTLDTALSKAQSTPKARAHVTNRNVNTLEKLLA